MGLLESIGSGLARASADLAYSKVVNSIDKSKKKKKAEKEKEEEAATAASTVSPADPMFAQSDQSPLYMPGGDPTVMPDVPSSSYTAAAVVVKKCPKCNMVSANPPMNCPYCGEDLLSVRPLTVEEMKNL